MLLQTSGTPQYFQCHWIHSVIFLDSLENPPLEAVGAEEDQPVLSVTEVCSQVPFFSLSLSIRTQEISACPYLCMDLYMGKEKSLCWYHFHGEKVSWSVLLILLVCSLPFLPFPSSSTFCKEVVLCYKVL